MGANAQTTVPSFTIGQVLTADQQNQSARTGVPVFATSVERDAAFGGSGEKTLAEGQLAYLEDSNVVQYYDGSGWATVGPSADSGLTLVSATTIGTTVSSVTVSSAFSAAYDSYKIVVSGGAGSTSLNLLMQLGASATAYYFGGKGRSYAGSDKIQIDDVVRDATPDEAAAIDAAHAAAAAAEQAATDAAAARASALAKLVGLGLTPDEIAALVGA
jgi:hypothetical protein